MAKVQSLHSRPSLAINKIHFCALLFAMVTCHGFLLAEARPIRSLNKRELVFVEAETKPMDSHHNTAGQKDLLHATSNHILGIVQLTPQKEETSSQDAPKEGISFDTKPKAHMDDFRPTAPGSSPGAGHSFVKDTIPKEQGNGLGDNHSVTGIAGDFKTTAPGHSPGVGHAFVGYTGTHQSKAPIDGSSTSPLTGDTEELKSTEPGHSPGVGHSLPTTSAVMNP